MNRPDDVFDVIIVGAGMAGSALACALGGAGLRLALIESAPLQLEWPVADNSVDHYDARVSALTVASQQFLDRLGVWSPIASQRVCAYQQMRVWDADGTGAIAFDAGEVNCDALGHIVENRLITTALARQLAGAGVQLFNPARVAKLWQRDSDLQGVELDDGRRLVASLVVAADGANSQLRQLAGMATREWDYQQSAIVATVQTAHAHEHTAWQRFLPSGPLAFLPLAGDGHCCSIVWSADSAEAQRLMALDDSAFASELGAAFEQRLGSIVAISRRFSFPLRQRHAGDYVQERLVLVGDAAHTIHPLAGQGINLGLADVQVLAEEVLHAHHRGLDCGDAAALARYQRRRKGENLLMMAAMESFKRLFGERALPLRWLRNTGMSLVDRSGPLKRKLMREAMGL